MFGNSLLSTTGKEIEIIHPGQHNLDAGPDFSAAVIRSEEMEWGGNVEIHVKGSDWKRHGHHTDPAYDTVILHVVGVDDEAVKRTDGTDILQACVAPPAEFFDRYLVLTEKMDTPTCLPWIESVPRLNRLDWISSLGIERLQLKADYMLQLLKANSGDWQQTIFIVMARALGFGLNGVPFEMLAKSLPLNYVMRHRDNLLQVEALAFGQAGMLDASFYPYDDYYQSLCREYDFLSKKYSLTALDPSIWKYARTRPGNFPHRRIAILSRMLADGMQLYSSILEAQGDYEPLMELLDVTASPYWGTHSRFGMPPGELPLSTSLSRSSREIVLINVMAPFYFAFGASTGDPDIAEQGLRLLRSLKAEKNSIINIWSSHGLTPETAFESQALLQLRKSYCDRSRCLECRFGHYLLRAAVRPQTTHRKNEKTAYTAK